MSEPPTKIGNVVTLVDEITPETTLFDWLVAPTFDDELSTADFPCEQLIF